VSKECRKKKKRGRLGEAYLARGDLRALKREHVTREKESRLRKVAGRGTVPAHKGETNSEAIEKQGEIKESAKKERSS